MKRPLIITIGITVILFVLGMWVYLLAYGSPSEPQEVFANLGFTTGGTAGTGSTVLPTTDEEGTAQLAIGNAELEQLTTRAVAGFAFASTGEKIWYAEQGTGYIFEIDLNSGIETQISRTTIPKTIEAVFSPEAVAITAFEGDSRRVIVGMFTGDDSEIEFSKLPLGAENVAFKDEDTLYYTLTSGGATVGRIYEIPNLATSQAFTIQIPDLQVHWGFLFDDIFVQAKPTQHFEGSLYKLSSNTLSPASFAAYGLASFMNEDYIVNSFIAEGKYISEATYENKQIRQPLLMLPEKCAFSSLSNGVSWCASPLAISDGQYLEDWYKGKISSQDYLWRTDLQDKKSSVIADLSKLAGKTIDVADIAIHDGDDLILLSNKLDQTLWLYRID